jgi:6-phosphofructokinase 1
LKKIGVFTSGGDAPGMNACIRAVVRTALYRGLEVEGIIHGYNGMIEGNFQTMQATSVSNIIHRGGTILKTSRSEAFLTPEGRKQAAENVRKVGIEGLVAIGGDGTFHGAQEFWQEHGLPTIGAPGTIDNDLYGTDYTIGYDTAINTALDAVSKIRDTATSHDRLFFVEVMGRHAGFIALDVAIAGGAEAVLVPECPQSVDDIVNTINRERRRGKTSMIFVVAEGDEIGGATCLAAEVSARTGKDYRVSILGHIQRGGAPSARDSVLASRLGAAAVEALMAGETGKMAGEVNGGIVLTPFPQTWEKKKPICHKTLELVKILSS